MRLVSQDKESDVPYDGVFLRIIERYDNCVVIVANFTDKFLVMGEYRDKEMALKVMRQLREAYKEFTASMKGSLLFLINPIFEFPATNEVET